MKQQTLNEYLKSRYGKKLYKISINAGLTCPNRDGTLGTGDGDKKLLIAPEWSKDKKRVLNLLRSKIETGPRFMS